MPRNLLSNLDALAQSFKNKYASASSSISPKTSLNSFRKWKRWRNKSFFETSAWFLAVTLRSRSCQPFMCPRPSLTSSCESSSWLGVSCCLGYWANCFSGNPQGSFFLGFIITQSSNQLLETPFITQTFFKSTGGLRQELS